MKILVCISHVPDTTAKIAFSSDRKAFVSAGVTFIINPYDEIALAKAIELGEAASGSVTVLNVGDAATEPTLRKALAIGAADAIRINASPREAYFVARQIAHVAGQEKYDLILCGRESIDNNGSSVPSMVAEMLGIPSVMFAKKLSLQDGKATLEREIEGGKEVVECPLPLVAGVAEGMAEPKIPNMRGIMSARTKPLKVLEPVDVPQLTRVNEFDTPASRSQVKMIAAEDAATLFDVLRAEKKVI
jgi:electron transfer flavoprotein beta subunit